jgi:hypothetical protein
VLTRQVLEPLPSPFCFCLFLVRTLYFLPGLPSNLNPPYLLLSPLPSSWDYQMVFSLRVGLAKPGRFLDEGGGSPWAFVCHGHCHPGLQAGASGTGSLSSEAGSP